MQTVFNDSAADNLHGGTDVDWFLPDPLDLVLDQAVGELISLVP